LVCLASVGAALEVPGEAQAGARRPEQAPKVSTAADGTVRFDGVPTFLIGAGWSTTDAVPRVLDLGIDILQSQGPGSTEAAVSRAVGSRGFVIPDYAAKHLRANYPNAIGFALPDEADANGYLPPAADQDAGPNYLPRTQRTGQTGRLIVQTLTSHFMKGQSKWDGIGEAEYRAYAANADVLLTDVYPMAHGCADPGVSRLSTVYEAMVELKELAPSKTAGEWIETGAIEGYCGLDPVSPLIARAEAWAAVAGGAQAVYWFTHSFAKGYWDDFDIAPEMAAAITTTNQELKKYSRILLARRSPTVVSATEDPIKVGLRVFKGQPYLIAVNLSDVPVTLSRDALAEGWWAQLPDLRDQTVAEVTTGRLRKAWAGRVQDTLPAFSLRIYTWLRDRTKATGP
jgi:hypothetical protein